MLQTLLKRPFSIKTPLLESIPLSQHLGKKVYLKMESSQPTGSFKLRGVGNLCMEMIEAGKKHFVSSSGGNAGYTVACIGRRLEIPVTVFLPTTTNPVFINRIHSTGAKIEQVGTVWDEANDAAADFVRKDPTAALIPPFDHPSIWAGHESLVDELVTQMEKPGAIIASVGGGGLACGLLQGMHKHGWNNVPLLAAEAEGAATLRASLKNHHLTTLSEVHTVAVTLATKKMTAALLEWTKKHTVIPVSITDAQAVRACYRFANDHRVLVEPACGVALALIYERVPQLRDYDSFLVIVCGGVGISMELLQEYLTKY